MGTSSLPAALYGAVAVLCWLWVSAVVAQEPAAVPGCLECHSASAAKPILAVLHTRHATIGSGDTGCRACHGESPNHARQPLDNLPGVVFNRGDGAAESAANETCQTCHARDTTAHWAASEHADGGLGCSDCHRVHERPAALTLGRVGADAGCLSCHAELRAALNMPSRHPILEGKTGCTDCHDPHGGGGEFALRDLSVNDNCTRCHSEKRGPFLWEHQPVTEDCSLCHRAHGSVHERLLTVRGPALCQQCHAAAFHPSVPYGGESFGGTAAAVNVQGKNCLNCHGQVHGSNHPSGARLTR
jgi:DmsE family decaheme c-type cytochrome